jgi:superfamily I DNA and/or RNA helicase
MERLSQGGLPMSVINTQRRMRPCISSLIRNTLYPKLEDSEVVQNYPDVRGFAKNVFFLSHNHREGGGGDESASKYNDFEVKMIKDMVIYLLRQGCYTGDGDIIILCAYLGQLARVRDALSDQVTVVLDERDQTALEDQEGEVDNDKTIPAIETVQASRKVKIRTIDNFQGEEGKIVILSLVRNCGDVEDDVPRDKHSAIGFLRSENRSNGTLINIDMTKSH